ncbi:MULTISPECIES: acyl carrier protein [Vagococcus]|uniref:Acyl carrier protein n=1 Tax=Vagococcus fluvialis bH819 TaxID=1255619 RepID=A0A1X6WMZ3_9ENTE|nr:MULTISPECIES: acyl carrier protein [Vagococcus]SLM85628.1 Acyl carrier protein [Vagococcus fluvialis bH819]HCM89594.1 acyl carrier protein [Vagococcus sp.]
MERQEVFVKIKEIVIEHFEIDEDKVTEAISIKDDLEADSISIMEFVLELEDVFEAEISDEDAEKIETIGAAVDYIMSKQ